MPKSWITRSAHEKLSAEMPEFVEAQRQGQPVVFFSRIITDYFGWYKSYQEELDERQRDHEAKVAEDILSGKRKPSSTEKDKTVDSDDEEEEEPEPTVMDHAMWVKVRSKSIKSWFYNNHPNRKKDVQCKFTFAGAPARTLTEYQLYSKQYYEERIKPRVEESLQKQVIDRKRMLVLTNQITKEIYDNEDEHVKEEIRQLRDRVLDERTEAMAKLRTLFKKDSDQECVRSPQDMARFLNVLGQVLKSIVDFLGPNTGWCWTIIGGGPDPRKPDAAFSTATYHSGTTPTGLNLGEHSPMLHELLMVPFAKFLADVYPLESQLKHVLIKGDLSIEAETAATLLSFSQKDQPVVANTDLSREEEEAEEVTKEALDKTTKRGKKRASKPKADSKAKADGKTNGQAAQAAGDTTEKSKRKKRKGAAAKSSEPEEVEGNETRTDAPTLPIVSGDQAPEVPAPISSIPAQPIVTTTGGSGPNPSDPINTSSAAVNSPNGMMGGGYSVSGDLMNGAQGGGLMGGGGEDFMGGGGDDLMSGGGGSFMNVNGGDMMGGGGGGVGGGGDLTNGGEGHFTNGGGGGLMGGSAGGSFMNGGGGDLMGVGGGHFMGGDGVNLLDDNGGNFMNSGGVGLVGNGRGNFMSGGSGDFMRGGGGRMNDAWNMGNTWVGNGMGGNSMRGGGNGMEDLGLGGVFGNGGEEQRFEGGAGGANMYNWRNWRNWRNLGTGNSLLELLHQDDDLVDMDEQSRRFGVNGWDHPAGQSNHGTEGVNMSAQRTSQNPIIIPPLQTAQSTLLHQPLGVAGPLNDQGQPIDNPVHPASTHTTPPPETDVSPAPQTGTTNEMPVDDSVPKDLEVKGKSAEESGRKRSADEAVSTEAISGKRARKIRQEAPDWVEEYKAYLVKDVDDPAWQLCVDRWFVYKVRCMKRGPRNTRLSSTSKRPAIIPLWFKKKLLQDPAITDVGEYASGWIEWWKELQPKERKGDPWSTDLTETKQSLTALKKPGNGPGSILAVVVGLRWWEKAEGTEVDWKRAVEAVSACLESFVER